MFDQIHQIQLYSIAMVPLVPWLQQVWCIHQLSYRLGDLGSYRKKKKGFQIGDLYEKDRNKSWTILSKYTLFLNASHFSPSTDFFVGIIIKSVLVLFSTLAEACLAWCFFFLLEVELNSSLITSYPCLAKVDTFVSFNFANAPDTTGEADEIVDFNLVNNVWLASSDAPSECDDASVFSCFEAPGEPSLQLVLSSFPSPKLSFTC